jgi:hypothetical protein
VRRGWPAWFLWRIFEAFLSRRVRGLGYSSVNVGAMIPIVNVRGLGYSSVNVGAMIPIV